ncbi:MAG: hypothetical protein K6C94_08795 [Candidatus Gastranaerophilales bacterium]|nr:hypothetical protein [Candidatus Gastranaerophilales bacterium]
MSNFIGANLLASVEKKIFPHGVAMDISKRLDSMTFVSNEDPENLDSFNTRNSLSASAATIFKAYGKSAEQLSTACKDSKLNVKVDSVETKYVADAEQTGSVSIYTFTDKYGRKVSINDIDTKQFIEREQGVVDDILQGVIDEIVAGNINLPSMDDEQMAA